MATQEEVINVLRNSDKKKVSVLIRNEWDETVCSLLYVPAQGDKPESAMWCDQLTGATATLPMQSIGDGWEIVYWDK